MTPPQPTNGKKAPARPRRASGARAGGALAAGAQRAGGERARRTSTPLISGSSEPARPAATAPARPTASETHRPTPDVTSGPSRKARAKTGERATAAKRPSRADIAARRAARPLKAVPDPAAAAVAAATTPGAAASKPDAKPSTSSTVVAPGIEELLKVAIATLRVGAQAAGVAPEDVEAAVARTLAYVRRRVAGDYAVDDFGFDADFTDHVALPLLRPLYRSWFRVEVRGIENIPATGGALVVANHSGTVAIDSLMTQVAIHDEHPDHRYLRMLGADLVFQTPFIGTFARRSGSTVASNPDAERLLTSGELVGVWPEGFKGIGKPFSERYKLQRFGRGGFVAAALKAQVPIIPTAIVGAEEIYPIIGNFKTLARLLGVPFVPITPTFPLLGPLGLVPLPSKWIIEFGRPIDTASVGPAAAEDPMLVFDLTDQVRETIQQSLYSLLMQRRSIFR